MLLKIKAITTNIKLNMTKILKLATLLMLLLSQTAVAEKYSVFEVANPDGKLLEILLNSGLERQDILRTDSLCVFIANDAVIDSLKSYSYKFSILIDDYSSYIENRNKPYISNNLDKIQSVNFKYGSMGGFFTFSEFIAEYDSLLAEFPNIVRKEIIGSSCEGREIYLYEFGNPNTSKESADVLLTALHHAREPASGMALLYFIKNLLDGYKNHDSTAEYLINNRNIFVVPIVNPDGYCYNEQNYPMGGGMWRKNRRKVSENAYGIDLNRNYGPYKFWDSPVGGSSDNPRIDNYRGTAPFSEPETQAIKSLCEKNNFKIAVNYHSYGNLLIYPWSAFPYDTPDSTLFRKFAFYSTKENRYVYGLDLQTLNYSSRGNSDDWMYFESDDKNKIYAFTAEVGDVADNFWCPIENIERICKDNLKMSYEFLFSASQNCRVIDFNINYGLPNSSIELEIANIGASQLENATVRISSLSDGIGLSDSEFSDISLLVGESKKIIAELYVQSSYENGSMSAFEIEIIQEDGLTRKDTLFARLYAPHKIDLFDGTLSNWDSGEWGLEFDSLLNKNVLACSPFRRYSNFANNYITSSSPIDIPAAETAELIFNSKLFIENTWDAGVVEVSTDGGASWKNLKSDRMVEGLGLNSSRQQAGKFYLQGNFFDYFRQNIDLSEFAGKKIKLRFGLLSDAGGNYDGWNISDIYINSYERYSKVEDAKADNKITKYSIVSGSKFAIINSDSEFTNYYLCDMEGRVLKSGTADSNTILLDTSKLPKAVYFLMLFSDKGISQQIVLLFE